MYYKRSLIMGQVIGPVEVGLYLPVIHNFAHCYMEEEDELYRLMDKFSYVSYQENGTLWIIEPYKKYIRKATFNKRVHDLMRGYDALYVISQQPIPQMPYRIASAIDIAKSFEKPCHIVKVPLPHQKIDYIQTGKRITEKRREMNLSLQQLAKKCNKKSADIYRLEVGDIRARIATYKLIADRLCTPIYEILVWKD